MLKCKAHGRCRVVFAVRTERKSLQKFCITCLIRNAQILSINLSADQRRNLRRIRVKRDDITVADPHKITISI